MSALQPIQTRRRCAIYTRKSAQPPIPQEITSLQSQRAICSAYIASQPHKLWIELPKAYDDAGRSGANLNRPALQELMADIELGLVDVVVVYKLDRITRTLLDFVRLTDFFDRYGVVFVAITQNFDTSDSMGRLIRNVLLTFAQFEREIASDRIRDKKRIMKENGLWTGGDPPLGYTLRRGKLLIDRREAPIVRRAFEVYVLTERITATHKMLLAEGWRRSRRRKGRRGAGTPIALSSLHHILKNPVYIGQLRHRGTCFKGVHEPILDCALWNRAQKILKDREQFKPRLAEHILTGLLFDSVGRTMHARETYNKAGSFRYYVSSSTAWAERQGLLKVRVQADQLEKLVLTALGRLLGNRAEIRQLLMEAGVLGSQLDELCDRNQVAAMRLSSLDVRQLSSAMKVLIYRVEVGTASVRLLLRVEALTKFLSWDGVGIFGLGDIEIPNVSRIHDLTIPVAMERHRRTSWLPIGPCKTKHAAPSTNLVALLDEARHAQQLIYANRGLGVAEVAKLAGRRAASFSRLVRLNYLAPDIVTSILDGTQPPGLGRRELIECDLPLDWAIQRRLLGFPDQRGVLAA